MTYSPRGAREVLSYCTTVLLSRDESSQALGLPRANFECFRMRLIETRTGRPGTEAIRSQAFSLLRAVRITRNAHGAEEGEGLGTRLIVDLPERIYELSARTRD